MSKPIFVDVFTASTLTKDNEICCPHCGSWTNLEDVKQDEFTGESSCPACRGGN
jgi:hypothetical protein